MSELITFGEKYLCLFDLKTLQQMENFNFLNMENSKGAVNEK
jgi:hypothetical protein